jgi:hypothetical protein
MTSCCESSAERSNRNGYATGRSRGIFRIAELSCFRYEFTNRGGNYYAMVREFPLVGSLGSIDAAVQLTLLAVLLLGWLFVTIAAWFIVLFTRSIQCRCTASLSAS